MRHVFKYGQFYNLKNGRFYRALFLMENFKYYKIFQGKKRRFIKFSSLTYSSILVFENGKFHKEIIWWKILNSI